MNWLCRSIRDSRQKSWQVAERKSPLPFGYRLQPLSGQFPRWRKTSEESGITVMNKKSQMRICLLGWGGGIYNLICDCHCLLQTFLQLLFVKAITARSWNGALGGLPQFPGHSCVLLLICDMWFNKSSDREEIPGIRYIWYEVNRVERKRK